MDDVRKGFFISYNSANAAWAEWIGHVLEDADHSVVIQAWDFRPGSNFMLEIQNALRQCERIIAVLSPAYLRAPFTQPEWAAALANDPEGAAGALIPVMVERCEPAGLLGQVVYIDLVGLAPDAAAKRLTDGVSRRRAKPPVRPFFPGQDNGSAHPPPAGRGRRVQRSAVVAAGVTLILATLAAVTLRADSDGTGDGASANGASAHGASGVGASASRVPASGGAASGGAVSGGAVSGGAVSGGAVSGGAASGGAASGVLAGPSSSLSRLPDNCGAQTAGSGQERPVLRNLIAETAQAKITRYKVPIVFGSAEAGIDFVRPQGDNAVVVGMKAANGKDNVHIEYPEMATIKGSCFTATATMVTQDPGTLTVKMWCRRGLPTAGGERNVPATGQVSFSVPLDGCFDGTINLDIILSSGSGVAQVLLRDLRVLSP